MNNEEKKAIERIEDFLTTNKIVAISSDETADSEEMKVFISKNEYLAIEFIANMFLKQSKEIEELKKDKLELINKHHVVHLKDVEKELREMRKTIDTKNAEIECLNVIHESYKEMVEENNYISKDKIREKIKKYDEWIKEGGDYVESLEAQRYALNELLEE